MTLPAGDPPDSVPAGEWPRSLDDGSEMGRRILARDWSTTPLGPIASWPSALRTALGMCLATRFPMFVYWGPERFQLYNDHGIPIMGAKHPDAAMAPVREVFPEIWQHIEPMFDAIARTGRADLAESQRLLMDRNGFVEEAYFTWSYAPIRDDSGRVVGIYTPAVETTGQVLGTRRLRTLQAIAERAAGALSVEDACRAALTALADDRADVPCALLYLTDEDGKTASLLGTSGLAPDFSGAPESVVLDGDGAAGWIVGPAARSGHASIVANACADLHVVPDPSGMVAPRTALVLPLEHGDAGRALGFLVVGLSQHLALEGEYRGFLELAAGAVAAVARAARSQRAAHERAEELAALDRAKTAFFSNVSHEFRTPLTLILGPVEDALADDAGLSGPKLELVRRNALRLFKMVNTLLDFSRMEAGRTKARYVPIDLSAATRELASAFQSAAEAAGLRLVIACRPLAETIFVDPEMWEEIVLNLISNAVKYTKQGEVEVALRLEKAEAVLSVRDTGVGIPADEVPRVFERFYRARSTEGRSHEGTGIGLAIVQELVKLHGGSVVAESRLGQGTTFTVRVPRGAAHLPLDRVDRAPRPRSVSKAAAPFVEEATRWSKVDDDALPSSMPVPSSPVPDEIADARILVVDDNADLRAYVTATLSPVFSNVETASDGLEALASAKRSPPALVVSDVMMPRLDGFGLVRELRADERTRAVPIILLSARAGEEATVSGLASGADDYLVKPFSARELMARVKARLEIDVMRRRSIEQAHTVAALEEAVRVRENFMAIASHELKTPLTPLELQLDTLTRHAPRITKDEEARQWLETRLAVLRRQHDRLDRLVTQLLDVSRLASSIPQSLELVDLGDVVRGVVTELDDLGNLERAGCALHTHISAKVVGRWDRFRLEQATRSLLLNACKFGAGEPVNVTVTTDGRTAKLIVRDEGIGISSEDQVRIFDRFERAVSSRHFGGFGLGLYIARQAVASLGGDIRVESKLGHGATFTVTLPIAPVEP